MNTSPSEGETGLVRQLLDLAEDAKQGCDPYVQRIAIKAASRIQHLEAVNADTLREYDKAVSALEGEVGRLKGSSNASRAAMEPVAHSAPEAEPSVATKP